MVRLALVIFMLFLYTVMFGAKWRWGPVELFPYVMDTFSSRPSLWFNWILWHHSIPRLPALRPSVLRKIHNVRRRWWVKFSAVRFWISALHSCADGSSVTGSITKIVSIPRTQQISHRSSSCPVHHQPGSIKCLPSSHHATERRDLLWAVKQAPIGI